MIVKAAQQRHRPFGQPGVLDYQAFVFNQRQTSSGSGFAGLGADQVLPLGMVNNDMRGAQLGGVIINASDADLASRMEAVALGQAVGANTAHFAIHHLPIEQGDDRGERTHPAQAFRAAGATAPALRLGPGERADDRRDCFGKHFGRRPARLIGDRKQHAIALNQLVFAQPGLAQEAFQRLRRSANARPLHFLRYRGRCSGQAAGNQREAARRGPDGDLAHGHAGGVHFLTKQLFQISARAGLHPRGDFLRAQFEKEIARLIGRAGGKPVAHTVHPGKSFSH